MADEHKKTVFLVVQQGFGARYLLRTDVLPTLRDAGARVVILTPNPEEGYMREEFAGVGDVHLEQLRKPPQVELRGVRWAVSYLRKWAVRHGHRTKALDGKSQRAIEKRLPDKPLMRRLFRLALHSAWRVKPLRRALLAWEIRRYHEDAHADLFTRYEPDLVVTTSPGYFAGDALVLREAAKRGIATAVVILSWDNPTSKGYRAANPDRVVVWSEHMAEQMVEFQDFKRDEVLVGGVPHFDFYFRAGALPSREELFAELGLDLERRLVFFATSSPGYYDRDAEVAEVLAEGMAEGRLPGPLQLVIRPHPNFPARDISLADFEDVARRHPHVHLNVPEITSKTLRSDMSARDSRRLGALLKHCDVLVNVFSTTTIEAFAMDRPVVLIDSKATVYEHMQEVLRSGAAPVARNHEEIVALTARYLDDPTLERAQRGRSARRELGPTDGRSGERIAGYLLEMIGVPAPAPRMADPTPEPARV